ncbi:hypothetical protein B0H13DRAFT_1873060 [Mycena leptocephala]|nr:hypothetical protein B0H13DRAFT_1873060 [Mycena leptocephala]
MYFLASSGPPEDVRSCTGCADRRLRAGRGRAGVGTGARGRVLTYTRYPSISLNVTSREIDVCWKLVRENETLILALSRSLRLDSILTGKQDLSRLEQETNAGPLRGAVDIAKMAKESRVITDARMGLEDLCAQILGKKLDKDIVDEDTGTVRIKPKLLGEYLKVVCLELLFLCIILMVK